MNKERRHDGHWSHEPLVDTESYNITQPCSFEDFLSLSVIFCAITYLCEIVTLCCCKQNQQTQNHTISHSHVRSNIFCHCLSFSILYTITYLCEIVTVGCCKQNHGHNIIFICAVCQNGKDPMFNYFWKKREISM